ncbi:periplasmic sensor signal transduction histidine kinase [Candidatus Protofrankia californiensis]|uniref:histidine kinase n=1 Tax=Candidatus Protofrankia californiensis TaxID=1839754 RepID=A0A1C3PG63_9ACTN|nr:periplasmic sensor signal transduction histidine kinase [Candidatus Protofrankia californiensis]
MPPILEVAGDEGRLRQAVGNLVRNAVVHTPSDTAISVVAEPIEAGPPGASGEPGPAGDGGTGEVVISVIDHGHGVPEDAVAHVFERFYRADSGRSRDAGGTGLGLSIVAAVATAHGGRVDYRPTPGGGATFRLILPRQTRRTQPCLLLPAVE